VGSEKGRDWQARVSLSEKSGEANRGDELNGSLLITISHSRPGKLNS
jgi:hypothetical protein